MLINGYDNFTRTLSCQKKMSLVSTQNQRCFNVVFDVESFSVDITSPDVATLFQHISKLKQH